MRNLTVLLGWFFLVAEIAADPVWIDVRTEAEFRAGHLEGVNERIDFDRIGPGVAALNLPADTEIRLYCRSGNRAGIAPTDPAAAGLPSCAECRQSGGCPPPVAAGASLTEQAQCLFQHLKSGAFPGCLLAQMATVQAGAR